MLLMVLLAVVCTATAQEARCGSNERYSPCVVPCNDCQIRGRCQFFTCNTGCDCIPGYFRDDGGRCINGDQCPNRGRCKPDEEYNSCGSSCPKTCENFNQTLYCTAQCVPGCFCRKGLVRATDGSCIQPHLCTPTGCPQYEEYSTCVNPCNDCKIKGKCQFFLCNKGCDCSKGYHRDTNGACIPEKFCPVENTCKPDETYYECTPSCKNTCERYNDPRIRCGCAPPGCFCKEGLVKRKDGQCVTLDQCEIKSCKPDEVYDKCGPACPVSCDTYQKPISCVQMCVPGCFCREGLIRGPGGRCIPLQQCPSRCGLNEEWLNCGSGCPRNCTNYNKPRLCTSQCTRGCFCKEGFVRGPLGTCIQPEQCPQVATCKPDEVYSNCGSACPLTCDTLRKPIVCGQQCVAGCFCREGMVRGPGGLCIPTQQCPSTCGAYEEWLTCGSACPRNCTNYDKPRLCTLQCVRGCFCTEGYVKGPQGNCILPQQCPQVVKRCRSDEVYLACGSACPKTCENYKDVVSCAGPCVPGCFCADGKARASDGRCVYYEECKPKCPPDEKYMDCGTPCPRNCSNYDKGFVCTYNCKKGCFCNDGLYRNSNGKCVEAHLCDGKDYQCPHNEKWVQCVSECADCWNRGDCDQDYCDPGCDCLPGFFRDDEGYCIPQEQCPPDEACTGAYEEYSMCKVPCNDCINKGRCSKHPCQAGCDCQHGYLRDVRGKCILASQCPAGCGKNEVVVKCAKPTWCNTCEIRGLCKLYNCSRGCDCKTGFYRNKNGVCIPQHMCPQPTVPPTVPPTIPPPVCGIDEKYYPCKPTCNNTCDNYNTKAACIYICIQGCDCSDGLVRNKEGRCIPPNQCPILPPVPICGLNEQYYPCKPTCNNTCDNYNMGSQCTRICVPGCDCKTGFVRAQDGTCILPQLCPLRCRDDEEYYPCMPDCKERCEQQNCTTDCRPGCFCRKGLVLRQDGRCVTKDQCPRPPINQCTRPNERFYSCIPYCRRTCVTLFVGICPRNLHCQSGCFCIEGLVQTRDGRCVAPGRCFNTRCKPDEEFFDCIPDCSNRCTPLSVCPLVCKRGCFCRRGLVLSDDNRCVARGQCPAPPNCRSDEQFYPCYSVCGNTCETLRQTNCPGGCARGCFCHTGQVRRSDGACVPPILCAQELPESSSEGSQIFGRRGGADDDDGNVTRPATKPTSPTTSNLTTTPFSNTATSSPVSPGTPPATTLPPTTSAKTATVVPRTGGKTSIVPGPTTTPKSPTTTQVPPTSLSAAPTTRVPTTTASSATTLSAAPTTRVPTTTASSATTLPPTIVTTISSPTGNPTGTTIK